jgi:hypothetical protein
MSFNNNRTHKHIHTHYQHTHGLYTDVHTYTYYETGIMFTTLHGRATLDTTRLNTPQAVFQLV